MAVKRGTTPIFTLTVNGESLKKCKVFVTFEQNGIILTKTGDSLDIEQTENGSKVSVYLDQAETLGFSVGEVNVQIRWIDFMNNAKATDIQTLNIEPILLEEVISYE